MRAVMDGPCRLAVLQPVLGVENKRGIKVGPIGRREGQAWQDERGVGGRDSASDS